MIVEYIRYRLPAAHAEAFEADYARAAAHLAASPFCLGYALDRCAEEAGTYVLRIRWSSADGHLEGFRRSEHFGPFLAAIRAYVPRIEEMRHYEPTSVADGRAE